MNKSQFNGIYILLTYSGRKYSLWRTQNEKEIEWAPNKFHHEFLLPRIRANMNKKLGNIPEDFDDLVGSLVKEWAENNDFTYDKVKIICSEYLYSR